MDICFVNVIHNSLLVELATNRLVYPARPIHFSRLLEVGVGPLPTQLPVRERNGSSLIDYKQTKTVLTTESLQGITTKSEAGF